MAGPWHPTSKAKVSARYPEAIGVCQRCAQWRQRRELVNQAEWQGMQLQPLNLWVCKRCLDRPQPQLRVIILPPDPVPVYLPFPEQYDIEEPSNMITADGSWLVTATGLQLVMASQITPTPDPDNPYLIPEDF